MIARPPRVCMRRRKLVLRRCLTALLRRLIFILRSFLHKSNDLHWHHYHCQPVVGPCKVIVTKMGQVEQTKPCEPCLLFVYHGLTHLRTQHRIVSQAFASNNQSRQETFPPTGLQSSSFAGKPWMVIPQRLSGLPGRPVYELQHSMLSLRDTDRFV